MRHYSFKRRRFTPHNRPFFIQRHVSDLIQRVVRIGVVVRIVNGAPIRKEYVHDRCHFAHGFSRRIPFFNANEVFLKVVVRIWVVFVDRFL